jgi:hypothetical protein
MNFKDIEEIVRSISDIAKIKYCEPMSMYSENSEFYSKRKANYKFMSLFIHMNEYSILICGVQFKDNKRIKEPILDVYDRDEKNLNHIVFNIEDYDSIMEQIKCNKRNLKKALKWIKKNTVS